VLPREGEAAGSGERAESFARHRIETQVAFRAGLLAAEQGRCCPIDAEVERPNERPIKRAEPLREFAARRRGHLVGAALTILAAWVAKYRPAPKKRLGGFEQWSRVIGGALDNAGVEGFLENIERFRENANEDAATLRAFIGVWADTHDEANVFALQLLPRSR
jgi:hypothetical protein